jgi:hypothetical protein
MAGVLDTGDYAFFRIFIDFMTPAITTTPAIIIHNTDTDDNLSPVTAILAIIYCWCR